MKNHQPGYLQHWEKIWISFSLHVFSKQYLIIHSSYLVWLGQLCGFNPQLWQDHFLLCGSRGWPSLIKLAVDNLHGNVWEALALRKRATPLTTIYAGNVQAQARHVQQQDLPLTSFMWRKSTGVFNKVFILSWILSTVVWVQSSLVIRFFLPINRALCLTQSHKAASGEFS